MTTTTSTFTPSTHTLEVDRMNFTPADLIPDSLRPSTYVIEAGEHLQDNGWNGLGADVETAGHIMRVFGFDEAEDEILDPGFAPGLEIPMQFWKTFGEEILPLPEPDPNMEPGSIDEILDPGFAPGLEIPIEFVDYPSLLQILGGQPVPPPILLPAVVHL